MKKYACPSCGAEVIFASAASVFSVCAYCKSMVVRHDMNLELLGKQAELPPDQSPLQIGTGGTYKGLHFTLQGRFRMKWHAGFWNEWFAWCDDGRVGWLGEAQGFLSFYFEISKKDFPPVSSLTAGRPIDFGDEIFHVADIKECEVAGSEGELPLRAPAGRKSMSVDFNGKEDQTATIEYSDDGIRAFRGTYCEFDEFHFSNLRTIDGW